MTVSSGEGRRSRGRSGSGGDGSSGSGGGGGGGGRSSRRKKGRSGGRGADAGEATRTLAEALSEYPGYINMGSGAGGGGEDGSGQNFHQQLEALLFGLADKADAKTVDDFQEKMEAWAVELDDTLDFLKGVCDDVAAAPDPAETYISERQLVRLTREIETAVEAVQGLSSGVEGEMSRIEGQYDTLYKNAVDVEEQLTSDTARLALVEREAKVLREDVTACAKASSHFATIADRVAVLEGEVARSTGEATKVQKYITDRVGAYDTEEQKQMAVLEFLKTEAATLRERIMERAAQLDDQHRDLAGAVDRWNEKHTREYRAVLQQALSMKDKYQQVEAALTELKDSHASALTSLRDENGLLIRELERSQTMNRLLVAAAAKHRPDCTCSCGQGGAPVADSLTYLEGGIDPNQQHQHEHGGGGGGGGESDDSHLVFVPSSAQGGSFGSTWGTGGFVTPSPRPSTTGGGGRGGSRMRGGGAYSAFGTLIDRPCRTTPTASLFGPGTFGYDDRRHGASRDGSQSARGRARPRRGVGGGGGRSGGGGGRGSGGRGSGAHGIAMRPQTAPAAKPPLEPRRPTAESKTAAAAATGAKHRKNVVAPGTKETKAA